jgi:hypothetical protein
MARFALSLFVLSLLPVEAQAVPGRIPFVGLLTYDSGGPVDDSLPVSVGIFAVASGGGPAWGPVALGSVDVENGIFSVVLGGAGQPSLSSVLSAGSQLWVEWTIDGVTLSPRQELLSVPYALMAGDAATLGGAPASSYATSVDLADELAAYVPTAPVSATAPANPEVGWLWVNSTTGILHVYRNGAWQPFASPGTVSGDLSVGGNASIAGTTTLGSYAVVGSSTAVCAPAIEGALRYNSAGKRLELCNGVAWLSVGGVEGLLGQSAATPAASCLAIKDANALAGSGVYWIDTNGGSPNDSYQAYCDMTTATGGWTLALNLDTSDGHVMWWANPLWTNGGVYGSVGTPFDGDHKSQAFNDLAGATQILLVVHQQGTIVGWKRFQRPNGNTLHQAMQGGDNTPIGSSVLAQDSGSVHGGERLVRLSTALYANHCVLTGGGCTSGSAGSPDGDRIGSHEGAPSDNNGGGLGNWHDMNYCCSGSFGSGKVCNGSAIRTASEAQSEWCGGHGYYGTDTYLPSTCANNNNNCTHANWAAASGIPYDYAVFLR